MKNFRYYIGALLYAPTLPIMFWQGKKIIKSVPKLPEAQVTSGIASATNSNETLKLLTIGESTIAGVGVDFHENGFTGSLAQTLAQNIQKNIDWRVYARSGYTVQKVIHKILPKIEEKHADLLVIGLGGNNAFALQSPKKWKNDIEELISVLNQQFPDTPIFFTQMPPIKEFPAFTPLIKATVGNLVEFYSDELGEISNSHKKVFFKNEIIRLKSWSKKFQLNKKREDYFSDGVHPSALAYQIWGKDLANQITKQLS